MHQMPRALMMSPSTVKVIILMLPSSSPQRESSVNQHSLRSEDDPPSNWKRGRGKGGRNMRILRNRITNQNKNDQQNVKILWKQWVKGYVEEINEIIKTNPQGLHIVCDDCGKNVTKQSYLRHRTVNGCPNINPRIKLFNWN